MVFQDLPDEILYQILLKSTYRSCLFLGWVYARAFRILKDERFWEDKLEHDYGPLNSKTWTWRRPKDDEYYPLGTLKWSQKIANDDYYVFGDTIPITWVMSFREYYIRKLSQNDCDIFSQYFKCSSECFKYAGRKGDLWLILYFLRVYNEPHRLHYDIFLSQAIINGHIHIIQYFLDNLDFSLQWNWISCLDYCMRYNLDIFHLFLKKSPQHIRDHYVYKEIPNYNKHNDPLLVALVYENKSWSTWFKWIIIKWSLY